MGFASVEEIETRAKEQECQLWETILHDDMTERQVDRLESIGKMLPKPSYWNLRMK